MTSPEAGADLPLKCFSFSKENNPETWPITCLTCDMVYIKLVGLHGPWRVTCHGRQLCCNHRLKLHSWVCLLWESFWYVFIICSWHGAAQTRLLCYTKTVRCWKYCLRCLFVFQPPLESAFFNTTLSHARLFNAEKNGGVCVYKSVEERTTLQNSSASLWRRKSCSQNKAFKICANLYTQRPTGIGTIVMHFLG